MMLDPIKGHAEVNLRNPSLVPTLQYTFKCIGEYSHSQKCSDGQLLVIDCEQLPAADNMACRDGRSTDWLHPYPLQGSNRSASLAQCKCAQQIKSVVIEMRFQDLRNTMPIHAYAATQGNTGS